MTEDATEDAGGGVERSAVRALVDVLTMGGEDAPALLVQLDEDWAAVAVKPSGILLVLLDAHAPQPWDALVTRASAVLLTETPEVLEGLYEGIMAVVLVGASRPKEDLEAAPAVIAALGRQVHWIALDPVRGTVVDGRRGLTPEATTAWKHIDILVASAAAKALASGARPARSRAAHVAVERAGEQALAAEARFRGVMKKRYPPVTAAILATCVVMMMLELAWGASAWAPGLVSMGALSGDLVGRGHVEALLAYSLLHAGTLHILMNGLALQSLGAILENLIGGRRFLVVFVVSALGGGIASALFKPEQLVVGASGGVFGLMTALLGLTMRRGGELPTLARLRLRQALGSALMFNFALSLIPGISLLGHAGGGVFGFVLGISGLASLGAPVPWMPAPEPVKAARTEKVYRAAAILCGASLALATAVAFVRNRPWSADPGPLHGERVEGTSWEVRIAERLAVHRDQARLTAGTLPGDPMSVRIETTSRSSGHSHPEGDDELLKRLLETKGPELTGKQRPMPRVIAVDGVRVARLDAKTKRGEAYGRWVFADGAVLVDVEVTLAAGAPPSWRGAFEAAAPRLAPR
jgi:rhomboid protease GluP